MTLVNAVVKCRGLAAIGPGVEIDIDGRTSTEPAPYVLICLQKSKLLLLESIVDDARIES